MKKTAKPDEPPVVWVARNVSKWGGSYCAWKICPVASDLGGFKTVNCLFQMKASFFHSSFPNIRLKPGEGPIKVRLRAEIVE